MADHKQNMTRNALFFLPAKVLEGILVIACSSLYTHIFTKGAVGTFGIVNTSVQFAYLLLAGWMANAATRYVGEEYQKDRGQALFSTVSTIYILIGVLVVVVCLLSSFFTGNLTYAAGAVMFLTYTLFQILNAALIQLGRVKASICFSLTSAVCKLAIAYGIVGRMANGYPNAYPAIFANTIADGIASIGAVIALSLPVLVRLHFFSAPLLQQLLRYGVPLMGVSISVGLLNQIDKYLVTGYYGEELFGIYTSNNSIASGVFTMISVGIMRGVYPAVLQGWREGGQTQAKPLLDSGVRLYLLIAMPAVTGLAAISLPMSRFLFAEGYDAGAPVIAFTALAMLFMGLTEYANKAYELEQSTISVLQNSAISAVIKIIASLLLLRTFGFIGGAIGSVVAFASYFIITCVRVRKRFLFRVPVRNLIRITVCAVLCGIAAFAVTCLPISNILRLLGGIAAGGIVYTLTIILSGEGRAEFQAICRKFLHRT